MVLVPPLTHSTVDGGRAMQQPAQEKAGGFEELYPFLYTEHSDLATVLQEVRRSTEEKVREIMALRDCLGHELANRLSTCAQAMARAFRAQGKLLAFGNGGSSTDAQALVQLCLHPPRGEGGTLNCAPSADAVAGNGLRP